MMKNKTKQKKQDSNTEIAIGYTLDNFFFQETFNLGKNLKSDKTGFISLVNEGEL